MRSTFSQRAGVEPAQIPFQIGTMSDAITVAAWNVILNLLEEARGANQETIRRFCATFIPATRDTIPDYESALISWVKAAFKALPWNRRYEFIEEFVALPLVTENECGQRLRFAAGHLRTLFNRALERHSCAYQFVGEELAPIVQVEEAQAIMRALDDASTNSLIGARQHLDAALAALAAKPDPDYRGCIREAMHAVESTARKLGKRDAKGVADALAEISKSSPLHGSLVAACKNLYGFTSDGEGIRHPMLEGPEPVGLDEARFMLVACAAFVSYLTGRARSGS